MRGGSGSEDASKTLLDSTSDVAVETLAIALLRMSAFSCMGMRIRQEQ
jgi:hypothetical protein